MTKSSSLTIIPDLYFYLSKIHLTLGSDLFIVEMMRFTMIS